MKTALMALVFLLVSAGAAQAEINAQTTPTRLDVRFGADIDAPPITVWRRIGQIDRWWSGDHTYSQNARNLHLDLHAGGCWCESWAGGSVEHMRVVMAMPAQMLRLVGALGPLQQAPVNGVMTFTLSRQNGHTHLALTYVVAGDQGEHLDQIAPGVDQVLGAQFARLVHLIQTGAAA